MSSDDRDHYEIYYADKLWQLLPAVYRAQDTDALDRNGPLRELVNRVGAQAAVVRRQMDRMWEDQSIETCDDWVIPYLADLLATNLVANLDGRGQRLDVAKTIYYRRRKGTLAVLEEIANDITGWEARVVEFFRRLGRTRHYGLDPELGLPSETDDPVGGRTLQLAQGLVGPLTNTQIGGWADVRNVYGASLSRTAFDEYYHTADVRLGKGMLGWHNIPRLGVFLWRLYSFPLEVPPDPDAGLSNPVAHASCPEQYAFDPTGREIPLFAEASRAEDSFGDNWITPQEWQLPTPISQPLLDKELTNLYTDSVDLNSFGVFRNSASNLIPATDLEVFPELGRFIVQLPAADDPQRLRVWYHYGFSSTIGAGAYDRRVLGEEPTPQPAPVASESGGGANLSAPLAALAPEGTLNIEDSLTYDTVSDVGTVATPIHQVTVRAENRRRPLIRLTGGGATPWVFTGEEGSTLDLEGLFLSGSDVVLRGQFARVTVSCCTFDPGGSGEASNPPAVFATSVDNRDLVPSLLRVEGQVRLLEIGRSIVGPIRTSGEGAIERLTITDSIVQAIRTAGFGIFELGHIKDARRLLIRLRNARDPLSAFIKNEFAPVDAALLNSYQPTQPPPPGLLSATLTVLNDLLQGPNIYDANRFAHVKLSASTALLLAENPAPGAQLIKLNRLLLEEAYPTELADLALATNDGDVEMERTTVLGPAFIQRLHASECILDDIFLVEDTQHGCVRFSAWSRGSVLPRKYESVEVAPRAALFTSRVFGHPGYAQLLAGADAAVLEGGISPTINEGAEDGSEMGAFAREKGPIKERGLLIKYEEYMPLGLVPVIIHVT